MLEERNKKIKQGLMMPKMQKKSFWMQAMKKSIFEDAKVNAIKF
jgi:hypothetical protein